MDLINKNFAELTPEDFDKTIAGLSGLTLIIAPFILQNKLGGIDAAAQFNLDLQIAADAVKEIKQQVYGKEGANDGENG